MIEVALTRPQDPTAAAPSPGAMLRRLLGYARPYITLIIAVAFFTLLFSAGRFGRAYLMKPLLDGVLVPVAGASAPPVRDDPSEAEGWFTAAIERLVPDPGLGATTDTGLVQGSTESAPGPPSGQDLGSVRAALRELLLAALVIVLVTPLALFGRSYLGEYVLGRIGIDIKQQIAGQLLQLPLTTHHSLRAGDLLSRALNDANAASQALKLIFQEFLVAITMLVIGLATLLYISPPLTLISLCSAPLIVLTLTLFGRRIRTTARKRQEQLGEVTSRLLGILSGIKVVKAFGGEATEAEAFARETRKLLRRDLKVVKHRVFSRAVVEALNSFAGIALLVIGAVLVVQGRWGLTTGDIAAFATVLATTYRPIKNLSKGHAKLMECLSSSERFFAVLDMPGESADPPGAVKLESIRQGIRFEDVCLSHPDGAGGERRVLDHISLDIAKGEVVAIVGRTGEGKTSLVDLLLRFQDPSSGRITIDGTDLRDTSRKSLRDQIAIVTQEPYLFDTTIRENIRYGRPSASDDDVQRAAQKAHVDEFTSRLPLGYDTEVGEFGARLSGGERQRITIARALLRRPAILIFDEATSALDAKTEQIVHEAIDSLRGERTLFLVAHRQSTIRLADRIVVLKNGALSQLGTDAELMAQAGLYRELASLQEEGKRAAAPGHSARQL